jgi:riboflavin kinase/FMN adenylyltransferase
VAGFDFRYGHKGKGNMETLKIEGKRFFEVKLIMKK